MKGVFTVNKKREWNWNTSYIKIFGSDIFEQRSKSVKIKSDLSMIFNIRRIDSLSLWLDLWKQLFRHIIHG